MRRDKATLFQWLGINTELDYSENTVLGGFIGALLILFTLILLLVAVVSLWTLCAALLGHGPYATGNTAEGIRNLGLLLAATVGLPFLVWRSVVAQKQVNVSEQGHITDRINEAVKGLGAEKIVKQINKTRRYKKDAENNWLIKHGKPVPALRPDGEPIVDFKSFEESLPNLEVRIGSIYALERIALDSPRDHVQIMEILCAYIRENAPAVSLAVSEPSPSKRPKLRIDIQAVINVIGRRTKQQIRIEWAHKYRLDLRNTNLSGGDFMRGDFSAAQFHHCRLEASIFDSSRLVGTQFFGSLLNYASFMNAELRGTRFDAVILNEPEPIKGGMAESINMGKILGVSLRGANILAVDYLGESVEMQKTFGSGGTILHADLEDDRKRLSKLREELTQLLRDKKPTQDLEKVIQEHGFVNWSKFGESDLSTRVQYKKFMKNLELVGFPYSDE